MFSSVQRTLILLIAFSFYCTICHGGTAIIEPQNGDQLNSLLGFAAYNLFSSVQSIFSTSNIFDLVYQAAVEKSVLKVGFVNENFISLALYKNESLAPQYASGFPVEIKAGFNNGSYQIMNLKFPSSITEKILYMGFNLRDIKWLLVNSDKLPPNINVLYDLDMITQISEQLRENHTVFSWQERQNLLRQYSDFSLMVNREERWLGDAFHGFLELTRYMGSESNFTLLHDIDLPIFEKTKIFMEANDEGVMYFRNYFVPRIESLIKRAGGVDEMLFKSNVIVQWCLAWQVPSCMDYASRIMYDWVEDPMETFVFPELRFVHSANWKCAAIANDEKFNHRHWDFLAALLSSGNVTDFYQTTENFEALQCTKNPELYRKSLEAAVESRNLGALTQLARPTPILEEFKLKIMTEVVTDALSRGQLEPYVFSLVMNNVVGMHKSRRPESTENLERIKLFLSKSRKMIGSNFVTSLRGPLEDAIDCVQSEENVFCGRWDRFNQILFNWLKANSSSK